MVPRFRGDDVWIPAYRPSCRKADCGNDNTCTIIYDAVYIFPGKSFFKKLKNTGTEITEPAEIIAYMNSCFLHDFNF